MPEVNVKATMPAKPKEDDSKLRPEVWPVMLDPEHDDILTTEFRVYDGGTQFVQEGEYTDTAYWNNDDLLAKLWTYDKQWRDDSPFDRLPVDAHYEIWGNDDSRVRPSAIATTFDAGNENRWNRKPLGAMAKEWRSDDQQWSIGGTYQYTDPTTGETVVKSDYSFFNIMIELKASADDPAKAFIDPDSYHDNESKKLKMKYAHQIDEIKPLIYYGLLMPGSKSGIKVSDQTKSFAHYLDSMGHYVYEWINDVYFHSFDTTDSEKIKITVDPVYTSDAVYESGHIIESGKKWNIYLMPRRWFFFVRYMQQENPLSLLNWLQLDTGQPVVRKHYVAFFWGRWPSDFSASFGLNRIFTKEATVQSVDATSTPTDSKSLIWMESKDTAREHALAAGIEQEEVDKIFLGSTTGNTHVVWSDRDDYVRIGPYTTLLGKLDGIKNDPLMQPPGTHEESLGYEVRIEDPDSENYGIKRLWRHIEQSAAWTGLIKPLRDSVIHKQDEETTDCSGPSPASRIQHIPYGIGVSPAREGDLLAVIQSGGRAFYIWSKTDEEFEEHVVGNPDGETDFRGPLRFESNRTDGALDHYSEQANPDHSGWLAVPRFYDADYADQFSGPEEGRRLDYFGRPMDWSDGIYVPPHVPPATVVGGQAVATDEEAELLLDAPVWIMASKERAFGDVYFGPGLPIDNDPETGELVYAPGSESDPAINGRNGALRERAGRGVFLVFEAWWNASYKRWDWLNGF